MNTKDEHEVIKDWQQDYTGSLYQEVGISSAM